jgi:hypothetical protein
MRAIIGSIYRIASRLVWVLALLAAGASPATAQSSDDVRQQLQELKQQYEQNTRAFQQRIEALEMQINKQDVQIRNGSGEQLQYVCRCT